MSHVFLFENVEVVKTGRSATKVGTSGQPLVSVEITPATTDMGTWKKWVHESNLMVIDDVPINPFDDEYHQMLQHVLDCGELRNDRTGTGTLATFGIMHQYDLQFGFPLITTKRMAWKAIVSELIWFLRGSTDERELARILHGDEGGPTIWTANAQDFAQRGNPEHDGDLGPVYGHQWRSWPSASGHIDQISDLIVGIMDDPHSRRHLVSAWNVADVPKMALPPCHYAFQFFVSNDGLLHCMWHQRSADMFLGMPFNIASYALLTMVIANITGLEPGMLIGTVGDAHIYNNHTTQVRQQLSNASYAPPSVVINRQLSLDALSSLTMDDFQLVGYQSHSQIAAAMST